MGFDLYARRKDVDSFRMGAFSWHWMLDAGVGLPLGYGKGYTPGKFVYKDRKDGLCIGYNDGARVTSKEAKQMAEIAEWIADYQDTLHECYQREPEEDRQRMESDNSGLYKLPARRDFIEKMRRFAEWARTSGGFRVH
jgi:hypothetical protein